MAPKSSARVVSKVTMTKTVVHLVVEKSVQKAVQATLPSKQWRTTTTHGQEAQEMENNNNNNGKESAADAKKIEPKEEKGKKGVEKGTRKRRRRNKEGSEYKRYVYKVLKQVHPELRLSSKGMTILNGLMKDMFERLAEEASGLCKHTGKRTLSSREIESAVRLVLPGDLGKHAIAEGTKAVNSYFATA